MWNVRSIGLVCLLASGMGARAGADQQQIAPGTAQQNATVVTTGANGICETTAAPGDIQLATVGSGTPFRAEIRCGADKTVSTPAAGDDTQLVALGAPCKNANVVVVDTGPDGIANSTALGDDVQVVPTGTAPANTACVITGGNGVADTATVAGDDNLVLSPVGAAQPNTPVVLCGPNGVADTTANNVNTSGDDVQVVAVGAACSPSDVVVNSGSNGIADTRAEGPDLVLSVPRSVRLSIGKGQPTASKTIKVIVSNVEFGASAPATRAYRLKVAKGSCPGGTVNQVDADLGLPGLQAVGNVPKGGRLKASFVVTVHLQDVTSAASNIPFRCTVDVDAVAVDTDPNVDDAANDQNNSATVAVDVTDKNDL